MTELKPNGRFQFGWIIKILSKDPDGFQVELADLGNGKHMIVVTDLAEMPEENTYRQAGFGPFVLEEGESLDSKISVLMEDLTKRRSAS